MLYFIGLGLGNEKDITVKGLEAVKSCDKIFLEHYTSVLGVEPSKLEEFFGKKLIIADRDLVESNAEVILDSAASGNTAFLVVGDVFGATTHSDLWIRAKERNIDVKVIHNASIMNACGCCGLQLYRFGQTVSLCFFTETWRPDSFYERIEQNHDMKLHTLCLLDIKVKEPDFKELVKGRTVYLPPRFMTCNQAIDELLEVEEKKGKGVCTPDTLAVGLARVGRDDQFICFGTLKELRDVDFGAPLHSLILCSPELHELELEMLNFFSVKNLPKHCRVCCGELHCLCFVITVNRSIVSSYCLISLLYRLIALSPYRFITPLPHHPIPSRHLNKHANRYRTTPTSIAIIQQSLRKQPLRERRPVRQHVNRVKLVEEGMAQHLRRYAPPPPPLLPVSRCLGT